jgi:glycine cleavage system H protein
MIGVERLKIGKYNLPNDLYYEENHFWVREDGDLLLMGLDDFGQAMAGEIVFVELPVEGKTLKAGKSFGKLESGKWVGSIYAPVSGEVVSINEKLEINPGLINEDCYGEGWICRIKPSNREELDRLIHGSGAVEKWLAAEIERHAKAK